MGTREKSALNGAAVDYLRSVKSRQHPPLTYEDISEMTGIGLTTLRRQMINQAEITVDDFLTIAGALGVSPRDALRALAEIVSE